MHVWLVVLTTIAAQSAAGQSQSCPANINFSDGTLNNWNAYTGNNKEGNGPTAIKQTYNNTVGATSFPEYALPFVNGISIITSQGTDQFGSFPTIPTINGYTYRYSILLGSTSVSQRPQMDQTDPNPPPNSGPQGGYVRGVSYQIDVPSGPATLPYTITYAYAMVLENGTHASAEQPMARAIINTPAGVIDCASPMYYLPTYGAGLDSATATANGFKVSPVVSPNESRNQQNPGQHLQDVWTKGWTEVTFDLSPYRGQQVTLTFEADNCIPGGHFAYAYFALRDVCAGLKISGDAFACTNNIIEYSIPALNQGSYQWTVPPGWTIVSDQGNIISVKVGSQEGTISVQARNSCTNLTDNLLVHLYRGALPECSISPKDTGICYGSTAVLHSLVSVGTEYTWSSRGSFQGARSGSITTRPYSFDITAAPEQTTKYILQVLNDGCPTPVTDTFNVIVVPPIKVDLGNDTLVVIDQPLRFHATSSDIYKDTYHWSPSTNLDNPDTSSPIGRYGYETNNITYTVTATDSIGCYGTANIKVTVAHTLPDIFVPNAFTPGGTSNSIFRPICIGIASLEYFRVYNRWGQLVYSTSRIGQGWDGRIQGRPQTGGAYLWISKGTDYTGRPIAKKGTMVLIR